MPIYEYRCKRGHNFEVMQRMTDDPVSECEVCSAPIQRVFHPIAVHFKGSGFYNTDYGTRKRSREKEAEKSSSKEGAGASSNGSKSDSSGSKSESTGSKSESGGSKSDSKSSKSESKASKAG
ncbi:MAG TPA: FmdB family zinc ribbon protein [Solirubrobacteraceae bacterium]|jgi:putative FmdB family regulatory protein